MNEKDTLFEHAADAGDFIFDERVVRVFPDMIRRSVPGYGLVLQMLGLLARRYVRADSSVYDLGCSLGAATLVMRQAVSVPGVRFVAVDNSLAMVEHCRRRLGSEDGLAPVELVHGDIIETDVNNASMTVLNYTLQFIAPEQRLALLGRIAAGTCPGGALVLSEKIRFEEAEEQALQTSLHHDFKRAQGYSDLEIAGKRTALEKVLLPDPESTHRQRLQAAGWGFSTRCFQSLNFVTYLAIR